VYHPLKPEERIKMKDEDIRELIDEVLNHPDENDLRDRWETFSVFEKRVSEINIIDLKGKKFKFPGEFEVSESKGSITFRAVSKS